MRGHPESEPERQASHSVPSWSADDHSDTEVIVHAYEQYGDGFLSHLDGMFALALWDVTTRTLTLARDRMGEKPLQYYAERGHFVFRSELRAILEDPEVPRDLSCRASRAIWPTSTCRFRTRSSPA